MTTATTASENLTPQAALDAAGAATAAADAALTSAREEVTAAEKRLAGLEAAFVASDAPTKSALSKARSAIETARSDVEWSVLTLQAAEVAHSRAADTEAHAQRRVIAEEYLAEHRACNDASSRENVLIAQLTDTVAELIRVVDARQQTHHRLATDVGTWPADEKLDLNRRLSGQAQGYPTSGGPLRPITTYCSRAFASFNVTVPKGEVAEAIEAGIAAAQR